MQEAKSMVCMKKKKCLSPLLLENKKLFLMCFPSQVFQILSSVDILANKRNIVLFEKCLVMYTKGTQTLLWQKMLGIKRMDFANSKFVMSSHPHSLWKCVQQKQAYKLVMHAIVKPCFGIGVWHTCIINIFTH